MISIIVAIGLNNELGKDNKLVWHLSTDLKFFKEKTIGKTIVMGYNTFKSLGRILPNRKHIVITSKNNLPEEVVVFHNLDNTLEYIKNMDEVFIIGGASIYKQFLEYADRLYITEINNSYEADVFFPKFDRNKYKKKIIDEDEENGINFRHILYERK